MISFEPIEPIKQWNPADDDVPGFHWQGIHHGNLSDWKPREGPLGDDRILILGAD